MPTGLTKDAGWEIGVSKTLHHPLEAVWALLVTEPELWLGPGAELPSEVGEPWQADDGTHGELRSFRDLDRVRLTWKLPYWDHDSTVQFVVRPVSTGTRITFLQERMVSAEERETQRTHWRTVVEAIVEALESE